MSEQACGFKCWWPPILRSMFLPSVMLVGSIGSTYVGRGLSYGVVLVATSFGAMSARDIL